MKIEAVDFFYLSMPVVTDDGDGSQDALVVKVSAGDFTGWGECEASPLVSIAAFVTPMSHGACQPVKNSVLGQQINDMSDIERIARLVARNSMDLLQAQHTWSGIEIALWDLLGNMRSEPVWRLLGYEQAYPKTPYASVLFGDTPQQTLERAQDARQRGFTAAKFGWGPFGTLSLQDDLDQLNVLVKGSAQMPHFWLMRVRYGELIWGRPRRVFPVSKQLERCGWKSRFMRTHSANMQIFRRVAKRSGLQVVRRPTARVWHAT